jgi:PAS domain S-box-containing protein
MTSLLHAPGCAPALPFEAVLAGLAQGVCITGPGGAILWTNPAAERILGGAPRVGMSFDVILARCGTRLAMRRAPWQDDGGNHGEIVTFHAMPASPATVALRALFEDTPVLVVLFHGAEHTYLFANAAYRNVLIGGADPVGRTLLEMLPEADTQGFVGVMDQVFASGQPYVAHETRFDLALPDGTSKAMYFNLVFEPVRDATGVIEGTLLVAADVTEAVVYRDVARQSQRQLQIALESGRMGAWRIDLDTNVLSADATFRAIHNAAEQEDLQAAIARMGHPDDQQLIRDTLAQTMAHGVPYDVEYRIVVDGATRWVAARGDAVHDDDGHVVAVTGVAFDIQQRKTTEFAQAAARARDAYLLQLDDALRNSTEPATLQASATRLLGEQLEASRIYYSEFDPDTGRASVDQQFSLPGTPSIEGTYDMAAFPAYLEALQAGPVVLSNVEAAAFLTPAEQASLAALEVRSLLSVPIVVNGKLAASLSAARIHARQWTEEDKFLVQATAERTWPGVQQARADEALREAARRKDEFLAMLAHELRNPLAPISAAAQLLHYGKHDEQRVLQASAIISRQVKHMTGLVDDLLDVSRVTTGMIVLDEARLDIHQIVLDAAEQVAPLLRAKRHQLQLQITPDETLVTGDRKRLVQVLANLLGNAAKYTHDAGLIIVRTSVHADHVLVTVRDNGIGMAPELKARAFDLFAQAERTSDRSLGGLGLGLALVKSLVELHRGTVTCDSAGPGQGSQFTICLPRAMPDVPALERTAPDAPAGKSAAALRILVVDDNVDAAAMLAMLLEASGHEVMVENGSVSALARASLEKPQVCLLDIGLPEMDGNELAKRLRADPATQHVLLIAITGYGQLEDQRQTQAAGFDHHFLKPVDMDQLNAVLAGAASRAA